MRAPAGIREASSAWRAAPSPDWAEAYLRHPLLGARLVECTSLMLGVADGASAHDVLGSPDDLKFRSSMTLFAAVAPAGAPFAAALDRFCAGRPDPATERLLGSA